MTGKAMVMGVVLGPLLFWAINPYLRQGMEVKVLPAIENDALRLCETRLGEMEFKYSLILNEMEKINAKLDAMSF